jgi:hypothetical protein
VGFHLAAPEFKTLFGGNPDGRLSYLGNDEPDLAKPEQFGYGLLVDRACAACFLNRALSVPQFVKR